MSKRRALLIVGLLSLLLLGYTSIRAARLAFTYDEAWTMLQVHQSVAELLTLHHLDLNNHPLNSVLIKVARRVLGRDPFVYRLPNLGAHVLYLTASLCLLARLRSGAAVLAGFALFHLNPFVLDFFSLARGYGLALGFTTLGLFCLARALDRPGWRWETAAVACLAPATLSNFSYVHALLGMQVVVGLLAIDRVRREETTVPARLRRLAVLTWPSLCVVAGILALVLPIVQRLRESGWLALGGRRGFWEDTVGSLGRTLLYRDTPDMASALVTVAVACAVAAVGWTAGRAWKRTGRFAAAPAAVFFVLLCMPAVTSTALHALDGTRYLTDRFALLFVPLFAVTGAQAVELWVARRERGVVVGALTLALILAANTARAANLRWTLNWRYDADVADVVGLLEEEHRRTGRPLHLMVSWPFKMPIRFYIGERKLEDWLTWDVYEYAPRDVRYDYFYLLGTGLDQYGLDHRFFVRHRHEIVRTFPDSGSWLLKGSGR